jgi:hypothetical protein
MSSRPRDELAAARARRRRAGLRRQLAPVLPVALSAAVLLAFLVYAFTR